MFKCSCMFALLVLCLFRFHFSFSAFCLEFSSFILCWTFISIIFICSVLNVFLWVWFPCSDLFFIRSIKILVRLWFFIFSRKKREISFYSFFDNRVHCFISIAEDIISSLDKHSLNLTMPNGRIVYVDFFSHWISTTKKLVYGMAYLANRILCAFRIINRNDFVCFRDSYCFGSGVSQTDVSSSQHGRENWSIQFNVISHTIYEYSIRSSGRWWCMLCFGKMKIKLEMTS